MGYKKDPMNAVTTKFVHMSMNKIRCPINVARVGYVSTYGFDLIFVSGHRMQRESWLVLRRASLPFGTGSLSISKQSSKPTIQPSVPWHGATTGTFSSLVTIQVSWNTGSPPWTTWRSFKDTRNQSEVSRSLRTIQSSLHVPMMEVLKFGILPLLRRNVHFLGIAGMWKILRGIRPRVCLCPEVRITW